MVAIRDMEMPKYCWGYSIESKKWKECPIYKSCRHHTSNIEVMPSDCPLVEIEERKQSEWYLRGGKFTCKNCEERALLKLTDATGGCREYNYYTSKFCPNCGAEMVGAENE